MCGVAVCAAATPEWDHWNNEMVATPENVLSIDGACTEGCTLNACKEVCSANGACAGFNYRSATAGAGCEYLSATEPRTEELGRTVFELIRGAHTPSGPPDCDPGDGHTRLGCDLLAPGAAEALADSCPNALKIVARIGATDPLEQAGAAIDAFLTPRPDWYVADEPYAWHKAAGKPTATAVTFKRHVNVGGHSWVTTVEELKASQFPADCGGRTVAVAHDWARFLGSMMVQTYNENLMTSVKERYIFYPLAPEQWPLLPQTMLDFCPAAVRNKWNCFFLAASNCTLGDDDARRVVAAGAGGGITLLKDGASERPPESLFARPNFSNRFHYEKIYIATHFLMVA